MGNKVRREHCEQREQEAIRRAWPVENLAFLSYDSASLDSPEALDHLPLPAPLLALVRDYARCDEALAGIGSLLQVPLTRVVQCGARRAPAYSVLYA
jgi:hypothetical protein